jgi:hypothetical protein
LRFSDVGGFFCQLYLQSASPSDAFRGNSGHDFYFTAHVRNHEVAGPFFECFPEFETGKQEKWMRRLFYSANIGLAWNVFAVSGKSIKNYASQFLRRNLPAGSGTVSATPSPAPAGSPK